MPAQSQDFDFDVVRTEGLGFSMMIHGEMIEVPIKFMRISEAKKLSEFVKRIVEKEVKILHEALTASLKNLEDL
jgi:hypothetical protein